MRQKDFVNEVDVFHSLLHQTVQFFENRSQRPFAVLVAKILFRAKRAMIWAPSRCLHFRSGSRRLGIKAMMMMLVSGEVIRIPMQSRQSLHVRVMRSTGADRAWFCGVAERV